MKRILIVEDNHQIVRVLEKYLLNAGYKVVSVYDGCEAISSFESGTFDLILLDIMLPKVDGFTVCRKIRAKSTVPIIMITAKSADIDRILGLEIGADDYIIKPFSPKEVVARVSALLRRIHFDKNSPQKKIALDTLIIHLEDRKAYINDKPLALTRKEFDLLALFVEYPQKIFSRENLLDSIWGMDYFGDARTVDSHIKRLRSKIESEKNLNWKIKTKWGEGYSLEAEK